jgi:hypothetical protein
MDRPLSNWLRNLFLAHWIISTLLGAALFLVPGRSLTLLGWVPQWVHLPESDLSIPGATFVDPVLSRFLGAALLAFAWSSFRGWRAKQRSEVEVVIQIEAVFCTLGVLAFIAGAVLREETMPVIGWIIAAILLVSVVGWGMALRRT